jgi:hypothetical protein
MYSMCNEILRCVRKTNAAVKNLTINNYESLCSNYCLTYSVWKAHGPYCIKIPELSGNMNYLKVIAYTLQFS